MPGKELRSLSLVKKSGQRREENIIGDLSTDGNDY
jgi:hypothetical protein